MAVTGGSDGSVILCNYEVGFRRRKRTVRRTVIRHISVDADL